MAVYDNFADLMAAAKAAAQEALQNEVADEVKQEIKTQEYEFVYNAYTPAVYDRRKSLGKKFKVEPDGSDAIRVWDAARPSPSVFNTPVKGPDGVFAQWINDGNVPNVFDEKDYPWMHPRKFYDAATKELRKTSKIKNAAKAGMEARL